MLILSILLSGLAAIVLASPSTDLTNPMGLLDGRDFTTACGARGSLSCKNNTIVSNLCCFEYPGGLLVQTQFWDTLPSNGPEDSWTIHGLWPDLCSGGFEKFCDRLRDYPADSLSDMLRDQGADETLEFMENFWLDIDGDPPSLWRHEWTKHGTCMSTFRTNCFPPGHPRGADAVAYFQATVRLFKTLPTYEWLEEQGITPSRSKTYTRSKLISALKAASGFVPALDCKSGVVSQVYWYFNLRGSAIDGEYVPVDAPRPGNCPPSGIKYTPKDTNAAGHSVNDSQWRSGISFIMDRFRHSLGLLVHGLLL